MGVFKKKADPISDRARALTAEIAALETQIQKLDTELQHRNSQPRLRSTTLPGGQRSSVPLGTTRPVEAVFESTLYEKEPAVLEPEVTPPHFNDLGLRKYDLPAALGRVRNFLSGPTARNPKLVSYLAAGSIKGLRPLRYEKRVVRNRFVLLAVVLVLMCWGLAAVLMRE